MQGHSSQPPRTRLLSTPPSAWGGEEGVGGGDHRAIPSTAGVSKASCACTWHRELPETWPGTGKSPVSTAGSSCPACSDLYQFPGAAVTQATHWLCQKNRHLLSHSSEGQKAKVKVWAGLGGREGPGGTLPAPSSFWGLQAEATSPPISASPAPLCPHSAAFC